MKPKRFKKSHVSPDQRADAAIPLDAPRGPKLPIWPERKPKRTKPLVVNVVELSDEEIQRGWDDSLYVPPTDEKDPFLRAQRIVISYALYYAPTIDKYRYTKHFAYRKAREIARPIAALGAGVPLDFGHLAEFAFAISDALLSWAAVDDHAVRAIARVFEAYAVPRGEYHQVVASRRR
jgi:hypothetical protein